MWLDIYDAKSQVKSLWILCYWS